MSVLLEGVALGLCVLVRARDDLRECVREVFGSVRGRVEGLVLPMDVEARCHFLFGYLRREADWHDEF